MNSIKKQVFFLVIFSLLVFNYSLNLRKDFINNNISPENHQWLSAVSLKFVKNWYNEGAINLKFGLFERPNSIEYETLNSRAIYPSYPPGCIVPIYFISFLTFNEPNLFLIYSYNLFNQYLIGLLLSIFSLYLFIKNGIKIGLSSILSTLPLFFVYLSPVCSYYFLRVYFADTSVILYFVLFLILEYLILENKYNNKRLIILQTFIAGIGILTDWLFVFVLFFTVINKFFYYDLKTTIKNSFVLLSAPIIALTLYLTQMLYFGQMQMLAYKYFQRTGHSNEKNCEVDIRLFNDQFWNIYVKNGYDKIGYYLILLVFVITIIVFLYTIFKKIATKNYNVSPIFSLVFIIVLSIFSQIYFFRCHSIVHNFSIVKFTVLLGIVPFTLLPLYFLNIFKVENYIIKNNILIFLFLVFSFYVGSLQHKILYFFPKDDLAYNEIGEIFKQEIKHDDIVLSYNFHIPALPPQQISYTMKEVHMVGNYTDIYTIAKNVKGNYNIVLFLSKKELTNLPGDLNEIIKDTVNSKEYNDYIIYRIPKNKLQNKFENLKDNTKKILQKKVFTYSELSYIYNNKLFLDSLSQIKFDSKIIKNSKVVFLNGEIDLLQYQSSVDSSINKKSNLIFYCKKDISKDLKVLAHEIDLNNNIKYHDFSTNTSFWEKGSFYIYNLTLDSLSIKNSIKVGFYSNINNQFKSESEIITIQQ